MGGRYPLTLSLESQHSPIQLLGHMTSVQSDMVEGRRIEQGEDAPFFWHSNPCGPEKPVLSSENEMNWPVVN